MRKRVVAIDYDGVIANTNEIKSAWIRKNVGLRVAPWKCVRTECLPIIGPTYYKAMCEETCGKEASLLAKPVPGAVRGITQIRQWCKLYVVTNRTTDQTRWAEVWLDSHNLRSMFEEVISSNGTIKASITDSIGADVLFDDEIRHLVGDATRSFQGFHFAPYLKTRVRYDESVTHVRSWRTFAELLVG